MNTDKDQQSFNEILDLATSEGRIKALAKAASFVAADLPGEMGTGRYDASERFSELLADIRDEVRLWREGQ